MVYIFTFLSWIVYLVFASLINKKYKDIKARGEKPKRYRLLGGLVGAVQGLILCFVTFLPISGLVNIVTDLQQQTVVAAVEVTEVSPTAKFMDENLTQDIKDIINGYSKSPVCGAGNIFNMNNNIFNAIASTEVDGINIYLRDEIINISNTYNNISCLLDIELNLENLKTINYNKVLTALDYLFESNILKAALPDFTDIIFDDLTKSENIKDNTELVDLLNSIKLELEAESGVVNNLKKELVCIVNTVKLIAQSSIIDQIPQEDETFDNERLSNVVEALEADKKYLFNNIIDVAFDSRVLNKVIVYGINKGINVVEQDLIKNLEDNTVNLGRINLNNKDLVLKKAEVKSMLSSLLNIASEFVDFDIDAVNDDFRTLFEYNLPYIIENAGTMMNAIQNMTVFNQTGIYDNLITQLARTSYNDYMDFDVLKVNNVWLIETKNLAGAIKKLVESKAISYLDKDGDSYKVETENITKMLEGLTVITEVNGESKTLIRQILEPIYGGRAFSKLINICFENLNDIIADIGELIESGTELGDLNLENIFTESEKEKALSFIDNIAIYVKSLDLEEVKANPFVTLLESNLTQLGTCLDLIKSQNMFADRVENGVTQNGVFTNLVDALVKTEYNDYINFACFTDDDLKFNEEFNNIEPTVRKMLSKQII
ncbi:MAG: hypothetical protein J6Q51_01700, partial [Clostridia bacterium]|nr:hypothetical protein [Clostridia bacterium]